MRIGATFVSLRRMCCRRSSVSIAFARLIDGIVPVDGALPKLQVAGYRDDARRFFSYFEGKYDRAPSFFLR
jgi:hypothetical protein